MPLAPQIATKSEFAAILGLSNARISQFLSTGKIHGDAIVGAGHRARINVDLAREQIRQSTDVVRSLGANAGKPQAAQAISIPPAPSKPASGGADTIENRIKAARFDQLALANKKAREEAATRAGKFMVTDDVRLEMGRIAARMTAMMEALMALFVGIGYRSGV